MTSGLETEFLTLHEFVRAARLKLTPHIWDYLIGGTETETTLRRNRQSLDEIALRPRVLRDVSRSMRREAARPQGQASGAAGADRLARILRCGCRRHGGDGGGAVRRADVLSSVTTPELEKVAEAGTGPKIFQLYPRGDRAGSMSGRAA